MILTEVSDRPKAEMLPAPDGFTFVRVTLLDGEQMTVIDPASKAHLSAGTKADSDTPTLGLIFQYILTGAISIRRLASSPLGHELIERVSAPGTHTVLDGVNVQPLAGFKEYTAVGDTTYMCVTMPDYYECHVEDILTIMNDNLPGDVFPLTDEGLVLRVVS
jgi:hypothetical protein